MRSEASSLRAFFYSPSKKLKEGKTVKIKGSEYTLSWGLVGAEKQKAVVETEDGEEKLTGNNKFLVQTNLSQKVSYPDIFEGVDVEYVMFSQGIKENLILKQQGTQTEFETVYNIDKLTAVQTDEQTIDLMAGEEVIYQIQAPYMEDAAGERSNDVTLTITETKNKKITVKMTVDGEWLAEETREFPVIIDPIVLTKTAKSAIDTTFITEDVPGANYSEKLELLVGKESSEYGDCRTLVKFTLPDLNPGDMVVDADLRLYTYAREFYSSSTPDLQIDAHQVTSSWTLAGVTWNNRPDYNDEVLDYNYISRDDTTTEKFFDITSAVKSWYEGTASNYGIIIKSYNESGSYADVGVKGYFWPERYNDVSDAYPVIQITYRNNKGLEDYWTYTTVSAGTAGTAYINDYTGNLVFVHEDMSTTGELLPVTLQHVYNGYMLSEKYTDNYPTDGRGWKLSIQQTLKSSSEYGLSGTSLTTFPYAYEDGDGTVHFFYKKTEDGTTKYYDEDGLGLELKIGSSTKTITDKKENVMTFNSAGNLSSIKDASGNKISISYTTCDDGNKMISKVTDGSGHVLTFAEHSSEYHYLKSITDPSGKVVKFAYPDSDTLGSGYLQTITYPDGTKSSYTYDSSGALKTAVSSDGSGLKFYYTSKAKGKRVSKVQEFGTDGTTGQTISFDRSEYNTTVIRTSGKDDVFGNDDDLVTTYQFDDYGRTVQSDSKTADGSNNYGGDVYSYTAGKVNSSGSNLKKINKVSENAYVSKNTKNFLKNHSAETTGSWTSKKWKTGTSSYTAERTTDDAYFGSYSLKLTGTSVTGDGGASYYQTLTSDVLTAGSNYTFSAYIKTVDVEEANDLASGYGGCLAVRFTLADGSESSEYLYSDYVTGTSSTSFEKGWRRESVTFTMPEDAASAQLCVVLRNAKGTAYFDGLQVERGSATNAYNMLENSSFDVVSSGKPSNWTMGNNESTDGSSTTYKKDGSYSVKIVGKASASKYIYQQVPVSGSESDIYTVSCWAKADALKDSNEIERPFEVYVKIYYADGDPYTKVSTAEFNRDISGWQRSSMVFNLTNGVSGDNKTPTKITVGIRYYKQENVAYFDNVQLVKDVSNSYTYDEEGNIITSKENGENSSAFEYDDVSNLTAVTDSESNLYKYEYNDAHQVTEAVSPMGSKGKFTYADNGNLTSSTIASSGETMQIRTETEYTSAASGISAGAYVKKETDQNGYETTYDTDVLSGKLNSVTTPDGVSTSYSYNSTSDVLEKVSSAGSSVEYKYDSTNTKLTSITHNGFQYSFSYDIYGNLIDTKVADLVLATNTYAANNGKLLQTTYGNGDYKSYVYTKAGNISSEKVNGTTRHTWSYDSGQQLIWYKDLESNQQHVYDYDITGRVVSSKVRDLNITSTDQDSVLYSTRYSYDTLDQVKKRAITAGGRTYTSTYSYNENRQPSKLAFSTTRSITSGYDALGRLTSKTISTDTPVAVNYLYRTSKRNEGTDASIYKTTQLAREVFKDTGYRYTYDNMGNIVLIEKGTRSTAENASVTALEEITTVVSYQYDSKNQLIREDNVDLNKTILYSYDSGGNLTQKQEYAYTEGTVSGTPTTITYSYDSSWKDKLISYNGQSITYDQIGNPLSYLGMTLDWEGRTLKTITNGSTAISYRYDADGMRTGKTVGSTESEYYYADGQLVYEKRGGKELYYSYDANGTLSRIVYYNNGTLVGTFYVAVTSRGDVEELYNTSGEVKVRYRYDSWGNVISVEDGNGEAITSASHIGNVNPIRYRGYYYDAETGFYYVSSRYYDPEIGRFISADTTDVLGVQDNFDDLNLYAYCNNNPVNYTDPDGTLAIEIGYVVLTVLVVSYAYVGGVRRTIKTTKTYKVSKPYWNSHSHNKYKGYAIISFSVFTTTNVVKKGVSYYSEHKSTKKGKKRNKHEEGNARRMRDQGGEKKKKKPGWKRPR